MNFGKGSCVLMSNFNFHDIVGLQLRTDSPEAANFYRAELMAYAGDHGEGLPAVDLKWRHSSIPRSPGPGYQREVHKQLARWYFRLELNENRVEIDCVGNRIAIPIVWHMLVEPSLRYLAAMRGSLMLHAAAVVRSGKSLIFAGSGGVGKTTTSSLLLRYEPQWKLHADDYVFLGPGSRSYAFVTRAHAYADLLRWLPELRHSLTAAEVLRLLFFGWIRKLSGERLKLPVRLEASRLWPGRETALSADVGAVLLLGGRSDGKVTLRRLGSQDKPATKMLTINFHEMRHFIRLLRRFMGEQAADKNLSEWRDREREFLDKLVRETAIYELRIPMRAQSSDTLSRHLSSELAGLLNAQSEGIRSIKIE